MHKSIVKAALVGGLIVFLWGILAWMIFPFHKHSFNTFTNECKVASVIKENAPDKGLYILPNTYGYDENTSQSQMKKSMEIMDKGPFVFASVVPNGMGRGMVRPLVLAFIIQVIGAFIVCLMLYRTKGLTFFGKVGFVTLFGLGVGVLGLLPSWIWLGFPGGYVTVNLICMVIGWFLAGLAIAKLIRVAHNPR